MAQPITRSVLAGAVKAAVENVDHLPAGAERVERALAIAMSDPVIARGVTPVSRFRSETMQGIALAGVGQVVSVAGLGESLAIVLGWLGFQPDPAEVS